MVLLLALIVSGLLAVPVYQILVSIDLVSPDPFAGVAGWLMPLATALVGAVVVFVLAVAAVGVARPKGLAALALAASMLLPLVAVVLGVVYGGPVLRQNVEDGIAAQGAAAAEQGAAAVDSAVQRFQDELGQRGLDAGPLRDLVGWALRQGG
ncbi:hypothetical protein BJF78_10390 [Pseudonocardia sp. CNS-139]|nr:hypothetical protein BJF78_10390 [Pseudonocardia sp. CNS-139]